MHESVPKYLDGFKNSIELREWFPLLGPRTQKAIPSMGGLSYFNRYLLRVGEFVVPASANLTPSNTKFGRAFAPYDRDFSYIIDERDLTIDSRKEKQAEYPRTTILANDHPNMRLNCRAAIFKEFFVRLGHAKQAGYYTELDPKLELLLKALKFEIEIPDNGKSYDDPDFLPGGIYQTSSDISGSEIDFSNFYPLEIGPLPYEQNRFAVDPINFNGLKLFLPENDEILATIRARYVIERMNRKDEDTLSTDPDSPKSYKGVTRELPFSWLQ